MGHSVPLSRKRRQNSGCIVYVQTVFTEDISAGQALSQPADVTKRGGEDGGKETIGGGQERGREDECKQEDGKYSGGGGSTEAQQRKKRRLWGNIPSPLP